MSFYVTLHCRVNDTPLKSSLGSEHSILRRQEKLQAEFAMSSRPPALRKFQVGWICALAIEVAAAKEMLDVNFGILSKQDSLDTNAYILGRIGEHHIVIASLPEGQYGTTSATTVAVNMMRTFSGSIRIGLMVGTGGGIPSVSHDIPLGDVVVGCPDGTCGGIIQYDLGKAVAGGKYHQTGSLNSPPRSLLNAVIHMKATEYTDYLSYNGYVQKAIKRNSKTRQTFSRPDPRNDRLFEVDYEHPPNATTCDNCLPEEEKARNTRREATPQVHYGIIASGNTVIKHGATRGALYRETGALCFEMETAGLIMDFPCIVIRGICDYADSHKNKNWQGYASLVAAAYPKELLSYIPVGQVSQEKVLRDVCSEIVHEIKDVNKSLEKAYLQHERHHNEQRRTALTKEQQECHQAFKTSTYE
ncbi:hypothetical protein AJ79_07585 [Helicocarpus griseus UAMH5409]|uniref:Nucleoside phosphorylase domain-containing protein n=1 Tax=Helicocarpus griseus UAMH5409 TaxID=1447875 RepID=A0A2B7X1A6_9EURO|nr:hypothetical protein AJ79_07585 [Helicocarpus griseus UAMH5409]